MTKNIYYSENSLFASRGGNSPMSPDRPRAIIVGAGAGGIATAARLAKAGLEVIVFEKNTFPGGRCSFIHHDDYRFDQGPSLLLLPKLFSSTFNDLGTTLDEEGIHLYKCEPNYRVYFRDGEFVTLSTDQNLMKKEIEKWEGSSGYERFFGFLQESHRNYEFSMDEILTKNFPDITSLFSPQLFNKVSLLQIFESIYSRVSQYFFTDRLRRAFTFSSMYMGMSPYDAPGMYSLLQYTELTEGVWYPKGGFHKILEALMAISEKYGAVYRLSTPVDKVLISKEGITNGVRLSTGEEIKADVVVLNSDLVYSYRHLLSDQPTSYLDKALSLIPSHPISSIFPPTKTSLGLRNVSCSSISFYWGMNRVVPEFGVHSIFLANDYRESFDDIFKLHTMPQDPSFYINVPSRIDATAAPEGKDAFIALVPIGALNNAESKTQMEEVVERAREIIIDTIQKQFGFKDFRQWIDFELINTPETWQEKFNLSNGAILGLSHDLFNVMCFRPPIRHRSVRNLFFVGASTHPGTGVPICMAGAKLTSELILSDLGIHFPWKEKTTSKTYTSELDRPKSDHATASMVLWNAVWQCFFLFMSMMLKAVRVFTSKRI